MKHVSHRQENKWHYLSLLIFLLWSSAGMSQETEAVAMDELFNVEEKRYNKASQALGLDSEQTDLLSSFGKTVSNLDSHFLVLNVEGTAANLWSEARDKLQASDDLDDRWLYWQRLYMRRLLKQSPAFQSLAIEQQSALLWQLELKSRGQVDIELSTSTDLNILITGFDPFFLDREITQSNPSGAAVMALDGVVIEMAGITARIESLVVPVRYEDFDQGMIETLLSPYYDKVDMIATISMGRSDFDLERYPGLRRSAEAPDNLNIYTGASAKNPLIPLLNGEPLSGPEFVEFSLPIEKMLKAPGAYQVIDNRKVTTLDGDMTPESLSELDGKTAVRGGGGGYLSNEISYRSIRLRDALMPSLLVGHIHTPRISAFDPVATKKITAQIKEMLVLSLPALKQGRDGANQ